MSESTNLSLFEEEKENGKMDNKGDVERLEGLKSVNFVSLSVQESTIQPISININRVQYSNRIDIMWTEREKAIWLACAIDGEGTITASIQKSGSKGPSAYGNVSFPNKTKSYVDKYASLLDDFKVNYTITEHPYRTKAGMQTIYIVRTSTTLSAIRLLKIVLPYLTKEKEKAEEFINGYKKALAYKHERRLVILRLMEPGMYYTSKELAESLNITRGALYNRMQRLKDLDVVENVVRQEPGRSVSYWRLIHDE